MEKSLKGKKFFTFEKGLACFTGILLIMLVVFSCNNVLIRRGGGSLIIALPGARAAGAAQYTIELTGSNGTTQSKTLAGGTSVQFDDLAPDTYSISVKGMDDAGTLVFSGTATATVIAGETKSVTVELQNELGSLTVDFSGASVSTATTLTVTLTDSDGVSSERTSSGEEVYFENLIPRTYNIVVEGMDTNNKVVLGGASSATIEAGKTASTTVPLMEGVSDFASLQAAVAAGGTVNILKNIDVSSGLTVSKTVEILPAYQDVTLKNIGSENLFTVGTNGNLTIGGGEHTITLDGNKVAKEIIKMSSGTVTLASNGIISNAASTGVSVNGGTFKMTGGSITGNIGSSGGGVNLYSATFNMTGGSISGNTVTGFGGAVSMSSGTFSMSGGSIDKNSSDNRGGGVSVSGGSFNLSGGSITSNFAVNDGDGVYMSAGVFNMSGSAVIASNNDVYLYSGTSVNKITVSGELTGGDTVATITPSSYTAGTQVLYAGDAFLLAAAVSKFAVTPNPADGTQWTIDTSGNLKQQ